MAKPTASSRPDFASTSTAPTESTRSKGHCPICRAPTEPDFRPFCSRRCADVDLSRWLKGSYAVPGDIEADEDGDDSTAASTSGRPAPVDEDE